MEELWVVEWRARNVVPEPRLWPDLGEFEIVAADQFYALVWADYDALSRACQGYPYVRIGIPADGRWIGEDGDEVYVHNRRLLSSERELWDAMGLKPETFDATSWDDVDEDVVRGYVPTF